MRRVADVEIGFVFGRRDGPAVRGHQARSHPFVTNSS